MSKVTGNHVTMFASKGKLRSSERDIPTRHSDETVIRGVLQKRPKRLELYQKKTPIQVFSCEYCENFKNTYFEEHQQKATSNSAQLTWIKGPKSRNQCTAFITFFIVLQKIPNSFEITHK